MRYIIIASLFISLSFAGKVVMQSGYTKNTLLELYTSQGCSSCPPAEKWLSNITNSKLLWNRVIPIAFHVDYWNYIGWRDPYSSSLYSNRQREYRQKGSISSVYTPQFIQNSKEWRGYFDGKSIHIDSKQKSGILKAVIDDGNIKIKYSKWRDNLVYHVAYLGFKIPTKVTRGENSGRTLISDFIVLEYKKIDADSKTKNIKLLFKKNTKAKKYGLAIWVSNKKSLKIEQATGGWLN
jgi:hypothetical protein